MIDFMLIALPRSGTTWAANWLTEGNAVCLHDPLFEYHYEELDALEKPENGLLGVSCTGLYNFPKWLNAHPARKVILHRDLGEINPSLEALGLNPLEDSKGLRKIHGFHKMYTDLFLHPAEIYQYLLGKPFDRKAEMRHAQLKHMNIQPNFRTLPVEKSVMQRLLTELQGGA